MADQEELRPVFKLRPMEEAPEGPGRFIVVRDRGRIIQEARRIGDDIYAVARPDLGLHLSYFLGWVPMPRIIKAGEAEE